MFRLIIRPKEICFLALFVIIPTNFVVPTTAIDAATHMKLQRHTVCRTSACNDTGISILQNMDQSINPCDDFYQFVCGNFTKNAVIPEDRSTNELLSWAVEKVQERLKTSIEHGIIDSDPQSFQLLQSYYNTCMNKEQIRKNSDNEFLEILKNLGGWPVLAGNSWDGLGFDWIQTMHKLRKTGYSFDYIVYFNIVADMKNNTRQVIYLDQASLGIAQEYLSQGFQQEVVKAYFEYMIDFADVFGADREQAKKELEESLDFEIKLAKISLSSSEQRNATKLYNVMTIHELEIKYPSVPWLNYLNTMLSPHARVEAHEEVTVAVPSFFEKLPDLLAQTPNRTLANYVFWRVAKESANQLSERAQKVYRQFDAVMSGNVTILKWQECINHVNEKLPLATGALYVRRYFDVKTKASALEMIQNIRESFEQMLTKVDWMDKNTKAAALGKLARMVPLIAYPDELLDDEKLDEYHKDFKVYPESFLKTVLSWKLFSAAKQFEKFRKPVTKPDWTGIYGAAAVVNAYYNPMDNTILFPSGILQEAFFNVDNPKYVNYAGIGSMIGHEMTHSFDDTGSEFDKDGNLVDWWDPKTKQEYLMRTQCIVDQYSNYTIKEVDLNLKGKDTKGENIADNGGIKEAYFAYAAFERKNGTEPRLPGLESYTPKQTFWIANAHIWCAKYRPEYLKNMIETDPHTPNEYRINGPMSNMPEFSKDFDCPVGTIMNPIKKCTVW